MSRKITMLLMLLLALSIIAFIILNLLLGTVRIPAGDVIDILLGNHSDNRIWTNIVMKSRLPQSLTAAMAGRGRTCSERSADADGVPESACRPVGAWYKFRCESGCGVRGSSVRKYWWCDIEQTRSDRGGFDYLVRNYRLSAHYGFDCFCCA